MDEHLFHRPSVLSQIPRYTEILQILFKYGFWDLLKLAKLQGLLELTHLSYAEEAKELGEKPLEERIRLALEDLGPTFVKLGQILSSRRDLIDDALFSELRKLQKDVRPVEWKEIRLRVIEELGCPIEEVFSRFDEEPFAAASIAQVHLAVLKKEHRKVAVKIRRPHIRKTIDADIEVMRYLAAFIEKHVENSQVFEPCKMVEEFAKSIRQELNFEHEAGQQMDFARQFRDTESLHIPQIYPEYSTQKMLVAEYVTGLPVDDPKLLDKNDLDTGFLAEEMTRLVFRMIFEFGFFHADPHPGNLAVEKSGYIILYDFGWMGRFSENFRQHLALAIHGLVSHESTRLTEALLGMSMDGHVKDTASLQNDLALFSAEYLDRPLEEISLELTLNRLLEILRGHKLRMRQEFYLGVKALTQVEAIARTLHPGINYIRFGEPYARKVLEDNFSIPKLLKTSYWSALELLAFIKELPLEARNMFTRLKKGEFQFPIKHKIDPEGFEPLRSTMNHIANRLSLALIAASLLITSGLLIHAKIGPYWGQYPMLGLITFVAGVVLAGRLAWSILRHGGL